MCICIKTSLGRLATGICHVAMQHIWLHTPSPCIGSQVVIVTSNNFIVPNLWPHSICNLMLLVKGIDERYLDFVQIANCYDSKGME